MAMTCSGRRYYYNKVTRESVWRLTAGAAAASRAPAQTPAKTPERHARQRNTDVKVKPRRLDVNSTDVKPSRRHRSPAPSHPLLSPEGRRSTTGADASKSTSKNASASNSRSTNRSAVGSMSKPPIHSKSTTTTTPSHDRSPSRSRPSGGVGVVRASPSRTPIRKRTPLRMGEADEADEDENMEPYRSPHVGGRGGSGGMGGMGGWEGRADGENSGVDVGEGAQGTGLRRGGEEGMGDEWRRAVTEDGRAYAYNRRTRETKWLAGRRGAPRGVESHTPRAPYSGAQYEDYHQDQQAHQDQQVQQVQQVQQAQQAQQAQQVQQVQHEVLEPLSPLEEQTTPPSTAPASSYRTPEVSAVVSMLAFIHSYHHTLIPSYHHSYTHTTKPSYTHTTIPSYTHTIIPSYTHTIIHTLIPPYPHTLIPPFIHSYHHRPHPFCALAASWSACWCALRQPRA
jgi:hypothetical protein